MLITFFKHYGLIFNTYISLLAGVNVANSANSSWAYVEGQERER